MTTETPELSPCPCGGDPEIQPGHYPDWREVHCSKCGRIAFGRDEETAIAKWHSGVLSKNTNEGPHCANSDEPSDHREPKEGSTDG